MPKSKIRQNNQSNEQNRGVRQQRTWSPSHKTGRGGGNRK